MSIRLKVAAAAAGLAALFVSFGRPAARFTAMSRSKLRQRH